MTNQRQRPLFFAAIAIAAIWLLAWGGYTVAKNSKMTAEKLRAYAQSVDLRRLSGKDRAAAINTLAAKLNALSADERQQARMEGVWERWFEQMTEEEKSAFIEATMPTGFKQMLTAFEQLSEDKRRRAIGEALKRLRETQDNLRETGQSPGLTATNRPPAITPDMEKRVREIGLKTFYSESSAQTKAELAPILEELQRLMESGAIARGGPR
jgi:hypothetical protein